LCHEAASDPCEAITKAHFEQFVAYNRWANAPGKLFAQKRCEILAHLLNHQTHHRGQAHTILSIVTGREPPSLDLLLWQRNGPAPDLRTLAAGAAG
jgi:DinB family